MAGRKTDKIGRMCPKFVDDLQSVSMERIRKGLANPLKKGEIGLREMTELMTKTVNYQKVLEELRTKPKRKNTYE